MNSRHHSLRGANITDDLLDDSLRKVPEDTVTVDLSFNRITRQKLPEIVPFVRDRPKIMKFFIGWNYFSFQDLCEVLDSCDALNLVDQERITMESSHIEKMQKLMYESDKKRIQNEEEIGELKKQNEKLRVDREKNMIKLEESIKRLTGYEANRNAAIEEFVTETVAESLGTLGFDVNDSKKRLKLSHPDSKQTFLELDGLVIAEKNSKIFLVCIEAKHYIRIDHIEEMETKLQKFSTFLDWAKQNKTSSIRKFTSDIAAFKPYLSKPVVVHGVLGGPSMTSNIREKAMLKFSVVVPSEDEYMCTFHESILM